MFSKTILLLCLLLAAPASQAPFAQAQTSLFPSLKKEGAPAAPLPLKEDIAERKSQNQKALEEAEKSFGGTSPESAPSAAEAEKLDLLKTLNLFYEQIQELLAQKEVLTQSKNQALKELNAWKAKPSFEEGQKNFAYLDQLQGQLFAETRKVDNSENTLKTFQDALEEARQEWDHSERERRRLKEQATENGSGASEFELENAQLSSDLNHARVNLRQQELENEKISVQIAEANRELLTQKIALLAKSAKLTQEEFKEKLGQLEAEKKTLQRDLGIARSGLENSERQNRSLTSADPESLPQAEVEERRFLSLEKLTYQSQVKNLTEQLQLIDKIESFWQRRYQLSNQTLDKSLLKDWKLEAQQTLESLQRKQQMAVMRFPQIRKESSEIADQLAANGLDPEARRWLKASEGQLDKLSDGTQVYIGNLYRTQQFYQKFLQELTPKISSLTLSQRAGLVWSQVKKVWNFELTTIDDQPITVRKLILVLILSIFGFRLARHASRLLGGRLFPRIGLEAGVSAGLQTLTFYLLVFLLTLLILYLVNVPLTLFTVLGGAFAIGFGFGSQNIVKNFISGLILLIERPIKIGDMVQLEDSSGVVERIGARSTLIRSFNNIHVIVPNSDLLEKKVINMHLSDDLVRTSIEVGVRYGSSPQAVSELMLRAAKEHPKILKNPEPIVLFTDFAENALKFEVHFWIRMRSLLERRTAESDIRFQVDKLFRDANIEFAYPQRDVHIDQSTPWKVQMMKE